MADYSATIIYTIRCKNPTITDLYVGHTTDFVKRRYAHRQLSLTQGNKLYEMIRNNGGWEKTLLIIKLIFREVFSIIGALGQSAFNH